METIRVEVNGCRYGWDNKFDSFDIAVTSQEYDLLQQYFETNSSYDVDTDLIYDSEVETIVRDIQEQALKQFKESLQEEYEIDSTIFEAELDTYIDFDDWFEEFDVSYNLEF